MIEEVKNEKERLKEEVKKGKMKTEEEIAEKQIELRERLRKIEGCEDGILYWNIKGKLKALEWVRGKEERI